MPYNVIMQMLLCYYADVIRLAPILQRELNSTQDQQSFYPEKSTVHHKVQIDGLSVRCVKKVHRYLLLIR